ncbi:TRAP transporter large permease [Fusobacterium perfoetens]|uniref:TRAP transporter large permease n=1 Tax=Fusobacterium perfoetens TaxID=852 RepID=UPI00047FB699|nr:TRAP transporter large permease [Fusobacterium perfoetens]MCI6152826.1 TRAP transporter large permease [Fusobacterium perfoetens]MDY3237236.1 TRAP transporter large permease [Fusobacterium perfoetens]
MEKLLPVLILFILFFCNIPISFALFASSLFYFLFMNTNTFADLILQTFIKSAESFPLLAIPFFIMAGAVMNYSGISDKLMKMAEVLSGHMKGGLAQVNVLLSVLMGGISGSANADAAMECKILVPEMTKRGFSKSFSAAITAASSAITPVIPPGINLIIYSLIANVSVAKMFLAGYVPGFLMCIALMVTVSIISRKRGYGATREKRATGKEVALQMKDSIWALLLPFGIILGMRVGFFTPTEAGAMAVLYCLFIGFFIYKELKIEHLAGIVKETVYGTSSVMFIIIGAGVFGQYLNWERIPHIIGEYLMNITSSPIAFLLIVNAILLLIGMFIEGGAAMIILAPLLIPTARSLGIDPVHFGIVMIVNIMIGGITPPFGSMMFLTCSIVDVPIKEFVKESLPFIVALFIVLVIVTFCPKLMLLLPNLI